MPTPMAISGRLAESDRSRHATHVLAEPAARVEQRLIEGEDDAWSRRAR